MKRTITRKLFAASLLACGVATGCHTANKKNPTTQQIAATPPLNQAVLNVPAAPPSAAAAPAATPAAVAAQPVVYDPPPADQPAPAAGEAVADASDSVAPVARSRPIRKPTASGGGNASVKTAKAAKATYTIKKGDSLWSIAEDRYGDGNKWKRIAAANPKINPNRVQAGQTITLP